MNKEHLIQKYFEGHLTDDEMQEFQSYLETDAEFAEEVAYEEAVKKAITLNARADLKTTLQSFEKTSTQKKSAFAWYIAASIMVFLCVGFWFINQSPDTSDLYDTYYQSYPNVELPTVRGAHNADLKSQAFYAYDQGNYQRASELFSEIYGNTKDGYALFYKAISLIELGKHKEAVADLDAIDVNSNQAYAPFITWYKALCYLKLDNEKAAKPLLKSLAKTDNPQREMATTLLSELE